MVKGLKAQERESQKEQLILAPISKRVRVISKREPEQWYRIVNRPGYAISSYKRAGRIVRDARWMEMEELKVDEGLFGERVGIYSNGQREYRNISSTLRNAQYLDGPTETEVLESIRDEVVPEPPKPIPPAIPPLTDEQRAWMHAREPKRDHPATGFPVRLYEYFRGLPDLPMLDEQLRDAIGGRYEMGRVNIDLKYPR
jgi:hypothetical protein